MCSSKIVTVLFLHAFLIICRLAKTKMAIAYDYGAGTSVMGQQSAPTHSDSDDDNKKSFSSEGEYGGLSFLSVCVHV